MQVALAVAMVIFTAYATGRVHQWARQSLERDEAFREGYNLASHALFHLAARSAPTAVSRGGAPETMAPSLAPTFDTGVVYRSQLDRTRYDNANS